MGGESSPLSRSHEFLPQGGGQGQFSESLGTGMVYGGEVLSDEVRSDVNVGAALLPHYRRPSAGSTKSAGGVALPLPGGANVPGHSKSFSGHLPTQKSNYRSVSVSSGGGGGGPVPVPNQQRSPSHSHSMAPAAAGGGGVAGGIGGGLVDGQNKTPPQRRTNYARHDVIRDASQLITSQGQSVS